MKRYIFVRNVAGYAGANVGQVVRWLAWTDRFLYAIPDRGPLITAVGVLIFGDLENIRH
jgi:hypothetical protein